MKIFIWSQTGALSFFGCYLYFCLTIKSQIFYSIYYSSLLLAIGYAYLSYTIYLDGNIFDGFELYRGLEGLYSMFANEALLLLFWLHFLAIRLFAGAWIVRDSKKYLIPKIITIPSLFLTYFTGPIGLVIYWFIRIFFAKKISFND